MTGDCFSLVFSPPLPRSLPWLHAGQRPNNTGGKIRRFWHRLFTPERSEERRDKRSVILLCFCFVYSSEATPSLPAEGKPGTRFAPERRGEMTLRKRITLSLPCYPLPERSEERRDKRSVIHTQAFPPASPTLFPVHYTGRG